MARIQNHWRADAAATAGGASLPVFIPRRAENVSVAAFPGSGGGATVEYSLAAGDDIEANPGAVTWVEWEPSEVTVNTARALAGPVIALRLQASVEDATMQVVASFDY